MQNKPTANVFENIKDQLRNQFFWGRGWWWPRLKFTNSLKTPSSIV